ncbi:carbon storage regulator CsrA [Caminibacter profundus]
MLVISRKENQRVKLGENIEIVIVEISKNQVKIGIEAPKEIQILRSELLEEIKNENKKASKKISIEDINKISKVLNEN